MREPRGDGIPEWAKGNGLTACVALGCFSSGILRNPLWLTDRYDFGCVLRTNEMAVEPECPAPTMYSRSAGRGASIISVPGLECSPAKVDSTATWSCVKQRDSRGESPRKSGRPFQFESDHPGRILQPPVIARRFELRRWKVAERLEQSAIVELVDRVGAGEFDGLAASPGCVGKSPRL